MVRKYDKNIKCKLCNQDETLDHLVNCEKNPQKSEKIDSILEKIYINENDIEFLTKISKIIKNKINARDSHDLICESEYAEQSADPSL